MAPTLGIGGDPPALTAGSSGDARQVRRQDPAKSRGNRVQTRTLVESHVGINDLSDHACMLAVHMTNYYTNNVHRRGAALNGPHRRRRSTHTPWTPPHPSDLLSSPPARLVQEPSARAPKGSAKT